MENLQLAANTAMTVVNARGALLINLLHDLRTMEPGFPMVDYPNTHEEVIEDFDDAAVAIVDIMPA